MPENSTGCGAFLSLRGYVPSSCSRRPLCPDAAHGGRAGGKTKRKLGAGATNFKRGEAASPGFSKGPMPLRGVLGETPNKRFVDTQTLLARTVHALYGRWASGGEMPDLNTSC
jgi:hypothetical protein